ncbi:MAG: arylesterase [Rhodospirillales bacterium]|nr:arylesterase [Rhodospirillales bacterium]
MAFVVFLAACSEETPRLAPLTEDAVVLAFGDSLTAGYGAPQGQGYPQVLEDMIGRRVVASGVPGEVSASGRARFASVLDRVRPSLVVLCHGGNDFLRRLDESQLTENLRAMVEDAETRGIPVVLIGVPRPGLLISEGAEVYRRIAEEFGLPYEAEALADILKQQKLKADVIHPNAAGYRRLAEAVAALLRASGAI